MFWFPDESNPPELILLSASCLMTVRAMLVGSNKVLDMIELMMKNPEEHNQLGCLSSAQISISRLAEFLEVLLID